MLGVSEPIAHLPAWIRRPDGSQAPFEPDRLCEALYAAAESLGPTSALLIRELTDAVLHFLGQESWDALPTERDIAEQVEKFVRELGHPKLALRYAEQQRHAPLPSKKQITIPCTSGPDAVVRDCLHSYVFETIYSRDVAAAGREGLLRLGSLDSPAMLAALVLETPRLADIPWWPILDDWRAAGARWIIDSPEWLCATRPHPALAAHLCEHLLALPTLGQRDVELHLNLAEPPSWSLAPSVRPLFGGDDDSVSQQERSSFLDNLLERWKTLTTPRVPAIAWHVHESAFTNETQRRQLAGMLRQALQGKPIRFIFDRPRTTPILAEGLDRRCPGVLMEIGVNLAMLARRAEIGSSAEHFLKKLPSLARMVVSAGQQQFRFLRSGPDEGLLRQGFLLDRASVVVTPLGLREVVQGATGENLARSPRALDFALLILQTLKDALQSAGRAVNLDLHLDGSAAWAGESLPPRDPGSEPRKQIETAGKLHARIGAGNATILLTEEEAANVDGLLELFHWAWSSTIIARVQLQPAGRVLQQGELAI